MNTWKDKLHYFNSGMATTMALLLAITGHALCFLFAVIAFVAWKLGDLVIEAKKDNDDR